MVKKSKFNKRDKKIKTKIAFLHKPYDLRIEEIESQS